MPGIRNENRNYVAVIGDLVGSRSLSRPERIEVQERFQESLDRVNGEFKDQIAALFLITAGDETQGILKGPGCCYRVVRQIQLDLAPTRIIFGLGYAPLTTALGEYAIGADGPAFHRAREALETAKRERKAYGKSIEREVLFFSENPARDKLVNALFLALAVIKSHWTEKQSKVLSLLEQNKTPPVVADFLKMPLSNVSRTVDKTHFREFEYLVESLESLLSDGFLG
ncbi:MAG: SatD family protein [bacterium]